VRVFFQLLDAGKDMREERFGVGRAFFGNVICFIGQID
jgi:hypothetical protein